MLNVFPIQFLAPLAFLLLRAVLGLLFLKMGSSQLKNRTNQKQRWVSSIICFLIGFLLLVGLYTQIAALLSLLIALLARTPYFKNRGIFHFDGITALLTGAISLSLFVTGGGPFGFDLPI